MASVTVISQGSGIGIGIEMVRERTTRARSSGGARSVPRRMVALLVQVALLGMLLSSVLANAARAEDKIAARDHWERGTKFYDLGKYDDAIREFEAAYEAKSDPAFLYNLAQSHRLAGHTNDALRFYRTYLRYVPRAANRADIEQRIAELEKIAAQRPMTEPAAPATGNPGSGIVGAPPAVIEPPAPERPDTAPATGMVTPPPLGSANNGADTAPPVSPGPSGNQPTQPTDVPRSGRQTAGIVLAASGAGLFVVGAVFGLVARSQSNKVETAASNRDVFDPGVQSLGKTSQTLQWVGYGVGMAAVATGVILYVTAPKAEEQSGPRVAWQPLLSPHLGGAALRVTF